MRGGMIRRGASGVELLVEALIWKNFPHGILRRVFEYACRLARLRVADDDATRRVWRVTRDACKFERVAVGERHVAVEAVDEDGAVWRERINQLFGRQRRVSVNVGP